MLKVYCIIGQLGDIAVYVIIQSINDLNKINNKLSC